MILYSEYSLSVIFPVYNEEDNLKMLLGQTVHCLKHLTSSWEIICVNDGSSDRSRDVVEELSTYNNNIKLINHEVNQGYGSALKSGFQVASKELVFFCDSDLQFHLTELLLMMIWIEQFDIVIGYRFPRKDPLIRRLNAYCWNRLVRVVLGLKVRDIDCAFKLFKRDVFKAIEIESVGAMVNTEILTQATKMNFKIKEVPVTHFPRQYGEQSGANLKVIIKAFRELYAMYGKLKNTPQIVFDNDRRIGAACLQSSGDNNRSGERRGHLLPICFKDRRARKIAVNGLSLSNNNLAKQKIIDGKDQQQSETPLGAEVEA